MKIEKMLISLVLLLVFSLFSSYSFAEEKITLTTYYPAPYGIYKELRSDQMAIGSGYRNSSLSNGDLIVSGNVGIGTPTPQATLHVAGNVIAGEMTIQKTKIESLAVGSGYANYTPPANGVIVQGNVGIGTTNPVQKLQVNNTPASSFVVTSSGNVGIGTVSPAGKFVVYGQTGTSTQNIAEIWENAADFNHKMLFLRASAMDSGGYFIQAYDGNSGTYPFVVRGDGNIGIGTLSPTAKLEVEGGDIQLADTMGHTPFTIKSYYNAGSLWLMSPTPKVVLADSHDWDRSASISYSAGTTGAGAGILTIGQIDKNSTNYTHGITRFYTNGVERMRIASDGNVGIGTTDPKSKLEVVEGSITAPNQPTFLAYKSYNTDDISTSSSIYPKYTTVIFDSEVYDEGNNYNNSNGFFTAPITGKYLFNITINLM
ncbi:MAG: hypothetical protein PHY56_06420 [Candidatus Omnitrophica bacterium]|nr:hypothetical protein [Candidatus Omnitrophota bacterium]